MACHFEVTTAQREERRLMKIKAKEQLKAVMKALKDDGGVEQIETNLEVWYSGKSLVVATLLYL